MFINCGILFWTHHGDRWWKYCEALWLCIDFSKIKSCASGIAFSFTADSFIKALMRFVSGRVLTREIYSDSGSNLVRAEGELREYPEGRLVKIES